LGLPHGAFIKTLPIIVEGRGMVLVLLRGDHRLNEIKLRNGMKTDFRQASAEEIEAQLGPVGYLGPVGSGLPIIKDAALTGDSYVSGANKPNTHLRGIDPSRDFEAYEMDVRTVEAGDTAPGGGEIAIETAIEIGNIFKLGTRYSEPLGATYLDENGVEKPIVMGSYGIGPARILAAAIEQNADERGIVWPQAIAPWQIHLVSLAKAGEPEREAADRLYEELLGTGAEVLYDDRDAGPGEKLTDAELLGCPLRIVAGRRGLAEGVVEASERAGGAEHKLPLEDAAAQALQLLGGADAASDG
ncbi:MAG TPA: YbaK/EbsC family protein, partial [Solirubrobacterales bacterium]|nr:YbaK/EbsC family protein [Solirubrobacterales bacterium]